jgi:hypothetical protein
MPGGRSSLTENRLTCLLHDLRAHSGTNDQPNLELIGMENDS